MIDIIASQTQLDSPEDKSQSQPFLHSDKFSSILMVHTHPDKYHHDKLMLRNEILMERLPKPVKQITRLFPNEVTICLPEDEAFLLGWNKKRLERDTEILKAQTNITTSIRAALSKHRLECPDLETLRIMKDQSLSTDSADEVVDLALRHQLMSSSVAMNDDRIIISIESITHGLEMIQNKN